MHITVIKIGTALLTNADGTIKISFLGRIAEEISAVHKAGWKVVLVSSGAMASGTGVLKSKPHDITSRSIFACVGQPLLMRYYADFFGVAGIPVAQTLLTRRDFEHAESSALLKTHMTEMLKNGILPIANENDLISLEELTVGDNDQLSARIAVLLGAEKLIILSDVDGLYSANPQTNPSAKRFEVVECITSDIEGCVGEKISKNSLGGMQSKLSAAKYATNNGVETIIFSGAEDRGALSKILLDNEKIGTKFLAQ